MSDRNYPITNVTIRVRRHGNRWMWELLDFFKYRVEHGTGFMRQVDAREAASRAKREYLASVEVVQIKIAVDATKQPVRYSAWRRSGPRRAEPPSGSPPSS
jgi:hypothetical protein